MTVANTSQKLNILLIKTIFTISLMGLIGWLTLTIFGLTPSVHSTGPDLSSLALPLLLLGHMGLGLVLFFGALAGGLAIASCAPASLKLTQID